MSDLEQRAKEFLDGPPAPSEAALYIELVTMLQKETEPYRTCLSNLVEAVERVRRIDVEAAQVSVVSYGGLKKQIELHTDHELAAAKELLGKEKG